MNLLRISHSHVISSALKPSKFCSSCCDSPLLTWGMVQVLQSNLSTLSFTIWLHIFSNAMLVFQEQREGRSDRDPSSVGIADISPSHRKELLHFFEDSLVTQFYSPGLFKVSHTVSDRLLTLWAPPSPRFHHPPRHWRPPPCQLPPSPHIRSNPRPLREVACKWQHATTRRAAACDSHILPWWLCIAS